MKKSTLKLEDKLVLKNQVYTLIKRDEKKALYKHNSNNYEVFKIKVVDNHANKLRFAKQRKQTLDLTNIPEFREVYPKDEDFGKTAWYITDLTKALKRYEDL